MTGAGTAFVTGGAGFIGRALVRRLQEAGWRVVALARDTTEVLPPGVDVRVADLTGGAGLPADLLEGVDVVFHCAGEVRRTWLMRPVHVEGTRRLLDVLAAGSERRFRPLHWVQLSSVGVYGPPPVPGQSRLVDEDSAEHPVGEYEVTKTEADHLVFDAAGRGLLTLSTLRPANVVGPGMPNASVRQFADAVRRGRFFYLGPPGAVTNYVHVEDVTSALLRCASSPAASGQVFNLSSDCPVEDLVRLIARSAGVREPRLRLPARLLRPAVGLMERVVRSPLTTSRIDALVNRTSYPTTKIERVLGFRHSRPMPGGIQDVIGPER